MGRTLRESGEWRELLHSSPRRLQSYYHPNQSMKLPLLEQVQIALNTRKKNGELVFDQDNLEVSVAGTFAADKFIVIRQKQERVESNPDPDLKQHHG